MNGFVHLGVLVIGLDS